MKNPKLNKEEKALHDAFEAGELKRVPAVQKEKARHQEYAQYTLSKPRNINIRLSERDFRRIKALAAEQGLPYQTLISSLLHQYSAEKEGRNSRK